MNNGRHIKPEWIPAAYQSSQDEAEEKGIKPQMQPLAPLYSRGKALLKTNINKPGKKP
ncbi:hypothetical protein [Mucilaginibacter sp. HD30]